MHIRLTSTPNTPHTSIPHLPFNPISPLLNFIYKIHQPFHKFHQTNQTLPQPLLNPTFFNRRTQLNSIPQYPESQFNIRTI
ncbi:peptidase dimerization domain-containing protein, partial [Staphylococcus pettenkoferi]|uniref:peptidase dimerization domain-containing protein n=1 Tax=Staphylococcus pettenkoferi TaxID=170573 RepID=UPI0021B55C72